MQQKLLILHRLFLGFGAWIWLTLYFGAEVSAQVGGGRQRDPDFDTLKVSLRRSFSEEQPQALEFLVAGHFLRSSGAGCKDLLWRERDGERLFLMPGVQERYLARWGSLSPLAGAEFVAIDQNNDGVQDLMFPSAPQQFAVLPSDGMAGFGERNFIEVPPLEKDARWFAGPSGVQQETRLYFESRRSENEFEVRWGDVEKSGLFSLKGGQKLASKANIEAVLSPQASEKIRLLLRRPGLPSVWDEAELGVRSGIWAELPSEQNWNSILTADFNGDKLSDLLSYGGPYQGWWLALDSQYGGLGHRATGNALIPEREGLVAADWDCDGRTDVFPKIIQGDLVQIAFSRISEFPALGQGSRFSTASRGVGPYVCLGFSPGQQNTQWHLENGQCPKDHALMAVNLFKHESYWAEVSVPRWLCCPLPETDILKNEQIATEDRCPEDSVAVGAEPGWSCPKCRQRLLCRKINTEKYQLSAPQAGVYWGKGRFYQKSSRQVYRSDIPVALRFGVGRSGLRKWDLDGCLGYPWGALLTRMPGVKSCDGAEFRSLQKKATSSQSGVRDVEMFPACAKLDDSEDPTSGCRE